MPNLSLQQLRRDFPSPIKCPKCGNDVSRPQNFNQTTETHLEELMNPTVMLYAKRQIICNLARRFVCENCTFFKADAWVDVAKDMLFKFARCSVRTPLQVAQERFRDAREAGNREGTDEEDESESEAESEAEPADAETEPDRGNCMICQYPITNLQITFSCPICAAVTHDECHQDDFNYHLAVGDVWENQLLIVGNLRYRILKCGNCRQILETRAINPQEMEAVDEASESGSDEVVG